MLSGCTDLKGTLHRTAHCIDRAGSCEGKAQQSELSAVLARLIGTLACREGRMGRVPAPGNVCILRRAEQA